MPDPAIAIPNLLYRYAMHFDDGDLLAAARLFDHGSVVVGGKRIAGAEPIVAMWRQWVRLYDGRPRTSRSTASSPRWPVRSLMPAIRRCATPWGWR